MRKGLRKISQLPLCPRVVFLRQQADVVAKREKAVEEFTGLVAAAKQDEVVDVPEAARKKCSFTRRQPILGRIRVIAMDQSIDHQFTPDGLDGSTNARIIGRQETHQRDHQQAGIQLARTVGLHKTSARAVEASRTDIFVDALTNLAPPIQLRGKLMFLRGLDRAVDGHPRHHFRMREVLPGRAHLPYSFVRFRPDRGNVIGQLALHGPGCFSRRQSREARMMQRIRHLAIHVELVLTRRGIADAHRARTFEAGQPGDFPFGEAPLTADAVHDLRLRGRSRQRANQPVPPALRFGDIACVEQRQQCERRITQPAIAVIPVPCTAEMLGQRCRSRGYNPSGRVVDECLEGHQRAEHRIAPGALELALASPFFPITFGVGQRGACLDGARHGQVRCRMCEHKVDFFALGNREVAHRAAAFASQRYRGTQGQFVRTRYGMQLARDIRDLADPWNDGAIVEPDDNGGAKLDPAGKATDDPDHVGSRIARRHEIDEHRGSRRCLKSGFEDERVRPVLATASRLRPRCDRPVSVIRSAEQRRETGRRIESRPAEPVDRAVSTHQRRGLSVADDGVVLYTSGHRSQAATSMTTFTSSGSRCRALGQSTSGTRRVIKAASHSVSAAARAATACS